MDFLRSYFDTNEPLTSWTLLSPLFFPYHCWLDLIWKKKWGKKCSTGQRFICTEVTSYKIHILVILCVYFLNVFQASELHWVRKKSWKFRIHSIFSFGCLTSEQDTCRAIVTGQKPPDFCRYVCYLTLFQLGWRG